MTTSIPNFITDVFFAEDVEDRALVKYPSIIFSVVIVYILFVKWIGPAALRDRKPFDLKYAMIIYDFAQSFANLYLTYTVIEFTIENWKNRCMVKNNPDLQNQMKRLVRISWQVYLLKIADMVDTVFFVLRKKDHQVSFLHVFHHALMCIICFFFLKSVKVDAMGFYLGIALSINTTVHVFVYMYYGLSAFGPHMTKYLWWKKYLTQLQICQFFVVLAYLVYGWCTGCEDFGKLEISIFLYVFTLTLLFFNFYKKYKDE